MKNLTMEVALEDQISNGYILRMVKTDENSSQTEQSTDSTSLYKNIYYTTYQPLDYSEMQSLKEFMFNQPGALKNYSSIKYDFWKDDFWKVFEDATNQQMLYQQVNPRLISVVMELNKKALTDPDLSDGDLRNVFDYDQSKLCQREKEVRDYFNRVGISQEEIDCSSEIWDITDQIVYFISRVNYFDNVRLKYLSPGGNKEALRTEVIFTHTFPDGMTEEITPELPGLFYALLDLADSKAQWERWISTDVGSFYQLYNSWFLNGIRLQEQVILTESSETEPFLDLLYDKNDLCRLSSFFDHELPTYNLNLNGFTNLFSGKRLTYNKESNSSIGYNTYDGILEQTITFEIVQWEVIQIRVASQSVRQQVGQ